MLDDDLRRGMYRFIRSQGRPVGRDEAARAVGISRKLAAFHLDKMVDRGLLTTSYARPPGRTGRGAGRPSKLYQPSDIELEVSIPERRYDLAGRMLLEALRTRHGAESGPEAARRVALEVGFEHGAGEKRRRRLRSPGSDRAIVVTREALAALGFEPYTRDDGSVGLRNCPFHALAEQASDVVCAMNRSFVEGFLRGLGNRTLEALLVPTPGECCVRVAVLGRS